jgi:hypothetical protein
MMLTYFAIFREVESPAINCMESLRNGFNEDRLIAKKSQNHKPISGCPLMSHPSM